MTYLSPDVPDKVQILEAVETVLGWQLDGPEPASPVGRPVISRTVSDAEICRTYEAVLGDPRTGIPRLPDDVERMADLMQGETRATAEHVMKRAREALGISLFEARQPEHLIDLALVARALVSMRELGKSSPERKSS
ncbi:hypothetical protein [Streptomyces nogalater]|uniref:Uncharacterized protein n=1 Tax=Streptomyces nogalater TaxID=38314 RepID=A0ABW0W9Y8_STRNO